MFGHANPVNIVEIVVLVVSLRLLLLFIYFAVFFCSSCCCFLVLKRFGETTDVIVTPQVNKTTTTIYEPLRLLSENISSRSVGCIDDKAGSFLHRYEATFVFVSVLCLVLLLWPVSGTKGFVLCIFYYYYLFILIFDC